MGKERICVLFKAPSNLQQEGEEEPFYLGALTFVKAVNLISRGNLENGQPRR